jgi:hypothetical protein
MAATETRVHFRPGDQPSGRPTVDVLASRFVTASGPRNALDGENIPIKPAPEGEYALGVPAHSQVAGKVVAIFAGSGYHVRVQCGAVITVTDKPVPVKVGTDGKAIAQGGSGVIVGYALSSTAADGDLVEVRLA